MTGIKFWFSSKHINESFTSCRKMAQKTHKCFIKFPIIPFPRPAVWFSENLFVHFPVGSQPVKFLFRGHCKQHLPLLNKTPLSANQWDRIMVLKLNWLQIHHVEQLSPCLMKCGPLERNDQFHCKVRWIIRNFHAWNSSHLGAVFSNNDCSWQKEVNLSLIPLCIQRLWRRRSPMSRSKFNGSRNVLTLLSVKMTERDMRQQRSSYYHSIRSLKG